MRIWLRTLTHVNFNHVVKIEVRYKVLRSNVKLSEILLLSLRATSCTVPLFSYYIIIFQDQKQILSGTPYALDEQSHGTL